MRETNRQTSELRMAHDNAEDAFTPEKNTISSSSACCEVCRASAWKTGAVRQQLLCPWLQLPRDGIAFGSWNGGIPGIDLCDFTLITCSSAAGFCLAGQRDRKIQLSASRGKIIIMALSPKIAAFSSYPMNYYLFQRAMSNLQRNQQ